MTAEEIKRDVSMVRMALSEGVEVEAIDRYTVEQIETLLKKLPRTKFEAQKEVVSHLIIYKDAKRQLSKVRGQQMLIANHKPDLTASPDRKAWVDNTPEVETAEIALIEAEAQLKIAEFLAEAHDDLFTAVKKIASIKVAQEEDAKNANRYGSN